MDQSDHSVEAFVVLLLGLFISTVLAPSSNAGIPSSLWSYVDQLDHICDYDWGQLVYRELIDEINRAKRHIVGEDADDDESSGSTYGGCFLALQLWICEIAGLGKVEKKDCSPRVLGWGRNSMDGILEQFRNLHPSDIRPPLSPLESERHLLDSTILPSDPQPALPTSTKFQPSNLKKSSKASKEEEDVLHLLHLRDQRILKLKEAAQLLSEELVGQNIEPLEFEEQGAPTVVSDSSGSSDKTRKKVVEWQASNCLTGFSVRSKHNEVGSSDSGGRGSKLAASRSVLTRARDQNLEGEEAGNGREGKKRAERQLTRSTTSTRAKQKEPANAQAGYGAAGASKKLSAANSRSFTTKCTNGITS